MTRGPDFFIVGAPKCGTTAMANYLGQHPEVGMCARKETHYFADDLRARLVVKSGQRPPARDLYLSLFSGVQDRRRLGEASVWYLYSAAAPCAIKAFSPAADILVMLRNPLEMLPSLHSQFVYVGIEPEEDFERALALDEERERSGAPRGFPPRSYRSAVRYAEQVERYLETFGADHVHVITYEAFRDRTLDAYCGTCGFLGVDAAFTPEIAVVNPNKRVRSRAVRRLVRRPPEPLRRALHAATSERLRRQTGTAMKRWNTRFEERPPISTGVAHALEPLVTEEVEALRRLLALDVSGWLEELQAITS